jgi:hypothetical protein
MIDILRKMGVPETYQGDRDDSYNLHDFTNKRGVLHHVKAVGRSAQDKTNLILSSQTTGIGKTRLIVGWLYHLWLFDIRRFRFMGKDKEENYDPTRYKFIDCRKFDLKFDLGGYHILDEIDYMIEKTRGLVIDDLGREGEKATRVYISLMSQCHSNKIPLGITTNLNLKAFYAKYGPDTKRRILDNGVAISLGQSS